MDIPIRIVIGTGVADQDLAIKELAVVGGQTVSVCPLGPLGNEIGIVEVYPRYLNNGRVEPPSVDLDGIPGTVSIAESRAVTEAMAQATRLAEAADRLPVTVYSSQK